MEYFEDWYGMIEEQKRKNKCVDLVIKPLILEKNPAEPHYFYKNLQKLANKLEENIC